ncbi:MAG: ABC transporter permease, partial [Planctomycetota bacterium]
FAKREWTIVGQFRAPATVMDAEIWVPLSDLQIATRRNGISCVVATLESAEFEDVDLFTKRRVDLELSAIRESDYYASLSKFYKPVQAMIWVTALLVSLAGILGGLNVMYAAFSARSREIGMLQALGFSRAAILLSLIQESLLATTSGTLIGLALSVFFLNGQSVRFSMGVFQLLIDPQVLLVGLIAGIGMGLLGAIPPAINCLRLPITETLKSI